MTYKELKEVIEKMPLHKQECDASVYVSGMDEVFPIKGFVSEDWDKLSEAERTSTHVDDIEGILDDNHPFLII